MLPVSEASTTANYSYPADSVMYTAWSGHASTYTEHPDTRSWKSTRCLLLLLRFDIPVSVPCLFISISDSRHVFPFPLLQLDSLTVWKHKPHTCYYSFLNSEGSENSDLVSYTVICILGTSFAKYFLQLQRYITIPEKTVTNKHARLRPVLFSTSLCVFIFWLFSCSYLAFQSYLK